MSKFDQKVQKEVSQMANRNLSCVMILGGLSKNLNHLKILFNNVSFHLSVVVNNICFNTKSSLCALSLKTTLMYYADLWISMC